LECWDPAGRPAFPLHMHSHPHPHPPIQHPPFKPRQLLAGATPAERARWQLGPDAAAHRLTAAAGCLSLPGVDDAHDLRVTRHAMRAVGLTPEIQEQIFRLLAALLHLGDIDFVPCPKSDGESCTIGAPARASLEAAAELLGSNAAALLKAVTTRTRVTPDGPIVSPLAAKAAADTRDALSKVGALRWLLFWGDWVLWIRGLGLV